MATHCRRTTIHTVRLLEKEGAVFYASRPCPGTLKEYKTNREGEKHCLVTILWDHFMAMGNPLWRFSYTPNKDAFPMRVVCSPLGKPYLIVGKYQGPAISFSEGGGKVWVALCGDGSEIGVDMAGTNEFKGEYPFRRVFHEPELRHTLSLTGGDVEQAAALLWSVKEAVVKAVGCAFHRVEPRQVYVYPTVRREGTYAFPVRLSGKALEHAPVCAGRSIWGYSLPQREGWFSIAHVTRTIHECSDGCLNQQVVTLSDDFSVSV